MKFTINFPEEIIKTKINSAMLCIAILLFACAIASISINSVVDLSNKGNISILLSCTAILTIIGAVVALFSIKKSVFAGSNTAIDCKVLEFSESEYEKILSAIEMKNWKKVLSISSQSSSVAMKLEVVYSKDKSVVAYQFFRYIPHNYNSCSDIIFLRSDELAGFSL